jgi:LysR family transcriptional regulator for bpeEF and oprC
MNFNLLKTFIKVAEFESFTKAAHQLKQPKSRVSRSIGRLEEDLKVQLIKRSTRSISLTEAGKDLYQETQGLIHQLEQKVESMSNSSGEVSGVLSISAPIDFGENIMPNLLCEFTKLYPKVKFKILLSDAYVDLTANDIDLALRVGRLKDSSLKQKKITETQLILVASKEYINLKGMPKSWEDFSDHNLLSFYNENHQDPLGDMYQMYGITPEMRVNSFPMLKKLVLESKGIAVLPSTLCKNEINKGRLLRVLPNWATQKSPLQVVFSSSKNLPPKTRAFIDFLTEKKASFL